MEKNLYIDASHPEETRIVLKSEHSIDEYEFEDKNKINFKNNIYLGTVSRVEPSLQAAFIDFGRIKHGFLAFNDIQSDYYQLPHADKENIKNVEEKIREDLKNKSLNDPIKSDQEESTDLKTEDQPTEENKSNIREKLKNSYGLRRYRIQEVIKPGQVILIQVLKEERGQKGAALTTFISLAGKYTVLMPNTPKGGGISRKIYNSSDRQKIRSILNEIEIPKSLGVIVRTAGSNKSKNDIEKDFHNTLKTWEEIKEKALNSNAPSLIYEEGDIIKRAVRDIYDNDTKNIFVDGNDGYQKAKIFMKELMPKNVKYVKKYRSKIPLFHYANIEKQLNNIFEPTVKLKSGGYIVINPTEALVAIDINSGQSTKQMNIEKTALNTNLEAAEEICRQLKLRDLSGLIVIDFIDMQNFYNKRLVEKKMRECVRKDRARIQLGRISNFGLLEMTRQRLREGSIKWETNLSIESFSQKIIKKIQLFALENKTKIVNTYLPHKMIKYLEINFSKEINYLQKKHLLKINLISAPNLLIPEFKVELLNKSKKVIKKFEFLKNIEDEKLTPNKDKPKIVKKNESKTIKEKKIKKKSKTLRTLWTRKKAS
ncbi:MAG: ribonuclease E/G [Candidatus Pelagibacter sp.]|nr:ribonuclease E/G [Candidatus Pelagibacter sp.]OUW24678.1 MAG: ribonuclease E/G [Rickettsiales bacterium TMED174]|tara:strand:- start:505 stop:2295 length:1791 start_codon:yes stop_codon:yes gene_type:complete